MQPDHPREELEQSTRENGKGDLSEVALASLEVDGKIIIPNNEKLKPYKNSKSNDENIRRQTQKAQWLRRRESRGDR
ncbi:MAG: hypothetical protein LUD68_09795 [Rikenellaceae bacterium]|nr:hypothetical protein [Rikenellaceae bacterium]